MITGDRPAPTARISDMQLYQYGIFSACGSQTNLASAQLSSSFADAEFAQPLRTYLLSTRNDEGSMTTGTRKTGDFCWINMLTPQPDAARDFYSQVLGWTYGESRAR